MKDRQYKGWTISGKNVHGMWRADKVGSLPLAADTLQGMKQLVTSVEDNPAEHERRLHRVYGGSPTPSIAEILGWSRLRTGAQPIVASE